MRVLSYTTIFPNRGMPCHGLFVKNRLRETSKRCEIGVVAPVNVTRDLRLLWKVPSREHVDGMEVIHPPFIVLPGLLKHLDGELLFRQTVGSVMRSLPVGSYDLIDAHYAYPDGFAAMRLSETTCLPFVITIRGSDMYLLTECPKRRDLIKKVLTRAVAVVAVSAALKKKAEELGIDAGKIRVIPNGIDKKVFYPRPRGSARHSLGLPADKRIIISVGRLVPVKGLDLLIKALARIPMVEKKIACFLVGTGGSEAELKREAASYGLENVVRFVGRIAPSELAMWYSAADLLCLFSHSEGCPNVVLEALACGTPVVATAVGGVPDMLRCGRDGFLLDGRETEAAAAEITKALEREWDRDEIVANPVLRDWTDVAADLVDLFGFAGRRK